MAKHSLKVNSLPLFFSLLVLLLAACGPSSRPPIVTITPPNNPVATLPREAPTQTPTLTVTPLLPSATPTLAPTATPKPELKVRFAVIGDYGQGEQAEADVAQMVLGWNPDIIITTGDNNYPIGSAETIDANVGQFYRSYIYPYLGSYGEGGTVNRFFPTLGNHDWMTTNAQPYLDYFTLPGNERYYDFTWGPVHFFALDSDSNEPDGVGSGSVQAAWLQERMAASSSAWQIVYMHQPPYSSGTHGSIDWARWPYAAWGADAVLGGHDHDYERLQIDGIPYFVNGIGGGPIYDFGPTAVEGSQFRYNADYGAMLVEATESLLRFALYNRAGEWIDGIEVQRTP